MVSVRYKIIKYQLTDLILRVVVDTVFEAIVVENVQLVSAVGPRNEDDVAVLRVEGEVLDVECAVRLNESRKQPEDTSVV